VLSFHHSGHADHEFRTVGFCLCVDRRDLAAAPALGERELGVDVDNSGVRRGQRFGRR
jgi:hypothetical protein